MQTILIIDDDIAIGNLEQGCLSWVAGKRIKQTDRKADGTGFLFPSICGFLIQVIVFCVVKKKLIERTMKAVEM